MTSFGNTITPHSLSVRRLRLYAGCEARLDSAYGIRRDKAPDSADVHEHHSWTASVPRVSSLKKCVHEPLPMNQVVSERVLSEAVRA